MHMEKINVPKSIIDVNKLLSRHQCRKLIIITIPDGKQKLFEVLFSFAELKRVMC